MATLASCIALFSGCSQQEGIEPAVEDVALTTAISQCGDITERAAAHLVAVVEFQRLEIIGRKARVFKLCMQDHGYIENKQWLIYSQPIIDKTAKENNISANEALENLRREQMVVAKTEQNKPIYWVKAISNKPKI